MNFRLLIDPNIIIQAEIYRRNPSLKDFLKTIETADDIEKFIPSFCLNKLFIAKLAQLKKYKSSKEISPLKKQAKDFVKNLLKKYQIAKTPSYVDIDEFDDLENALLVASAKAVDAFLVTNKKEIISKFPNISGTPSNTLKKVENYSENKKIPLMDLRGQIYEIYPDIEKAIDRVVNKANFILGEEVKLLEEKVAQYIGTKYAVGVSSGTDALVLTLRALVIKLKGKEYFDEEDLIITTPFTFTATGEAILRAGATPLFVDIDIDTYNIDPAQIEEAVEKYGSKVKGILLVHLYGQPANMDEIMRIANEYGLFVVEDCAQSFGAKWDGKQTGSFGIAGCFSFFPSKPLGGFGDGGMITTNDDELYEILLMLRKHGGKDKYNVEHIGYNARLDTIQASILWEKLKYIDELNRKRREIARYYDEHLKDIDWIATPKVLDKAYHVYHQYTIRISGRDRDDVQQKLKENRVQTMIYYPVPLHKMKVLQNNRMKIYGNLENSETASKFVLSLPIDPLYNKGKLEYIYEKCLLI